MAKPDIKFKVAVTVAAIANRMHSLTPVVETCVSFGLLVKSKPYPEIAEIMALLTILEFPDPRLRTKAVPVAEVTDETRKLIDDMFATMYNANGIGLAATQVNVHQRLLVIDLSEERNEPRVFINPEILSKEGVEVREEGCLSVPNFFEEVQRAERIRVRALDRDGKSFELDTDGLLAVCIQHEMDHLEGKLFVDYVSDLKRTRIRKKLEKEHKEMGDEPRYPAKTASHATAPSI